jgi:hypothetical protein
MRYRSGSLLRLAGIQRSNRSRVEKKLRLAGIQRSNRSRVEKKLRHSESLHFTTKYRREMMSLEAYL